MHSNTQSCTTYYYYYYFVQIDGIFAAMGVIGDLSEENFLNFLKKGNDRLQLHVHVCIFRWGWGRGRGIEVGDRTVCVTGRQMFDSAKIYTKVIVFMSLRSGKTIGKLPTPSRNLQK